LDTDRESFEATVTRFSEFSWTERYPKKIICVWPEDVLARRKRFVYGRVPVPSGNAARAQEIYETVMELDCSLPMADVCVGYSDHGASVRTLDALSSKADRGRSRLCLEQRSSDERGIRGKHGKTRRQNFCAFKKKDW